MIEWFHSKGVTKERYHDAVNILYDTVIESGDIDVLGYILDNFAMHHRIVSNQISRTNHVSMMKYVVENKGFSCNSSNLEVAFVYSSLEMVKYIDSVLENKIYKRLCDLVPSSEEGKNRWLVEKYPPPNSFIELEDLSDLVKYMCEKSLVTLCEDFFVACIESRNLELLQYLFEKGCPYPENSCEIAAHCRSHKILYWLIEMDFECSEEVFSTLLWQKKFTTIEKIYNMGVPLDKSLLLKEAIEICTRKIMCQQKYQDYEKFIDWLKTL